MFRFLTAGESHGKALIAIIEGVPAGLPLDENFVARDLIRRQGGYGRGQRMEIENDRAEILSGVRHGLTIGSPISLLIPNRDWKNWKDLMSILPVANKTELVTHLRPGHADLAGVVKYGLNDIRPILERASARETAARVAVGAVAKKLIEQFQIEVRSHVVCIGGQWVKDTDTINWDQVEKSPVRSADPNAEKAMTATIDQARENGDSVGGVVEIIASGIPIGLGSYVHWNRRLDGRIAQALMSIHAIKGVEIGAGFAHANLLGSQAHDVITYEGNRQWQHTTNRAGGIEGGMSNGEPVVIRTVVKPIPTLGKPLSSVDLITGNPVEAHVERSDVCVVPAAGVVGEAMLAIVLADALLEKFGGDHITETLRNYQKYLGSIGPGRGDE
ncbi:chorismate synthase [Chloroflexota bacterium]